MKPIGTKNEFAVGGCWCPSQVELLQAVQPTPVGDKTQNPKCFFFIIDSMLEKPYNLIGQLGKVVSNEDHACWKVMGSNPSTTRVFFPCS